MRIARVLTAALATLLLTPANGADDFYAIRLQEGREALRVGHPVEAVDLLQIACFGLLNRPAALSEGLVWLTLAQGKAGRASDVATTLRRFVDLEERFPVYAKVELEPSARSEFEALLVKRLPPEKLLTLPALAHLVETEEQKMAKLPAPAREKVLEARAKTWPKEPSWPLMLARTYVEQKDPKKAAHWASRVLELDEANVEARTIRARAHVARQEYADALSDLDRLPVDRLEADPALRGDKLLCLVATKRWKAARELAGSLPKQQLARPEVAEALKRMPAGTP